MNGAFASRMVTGARGRLAIDLLLFAALGLLMAILGPYRTIESPPLLRTAYWLTAIVAGGLAAVAADRLLGARIPRFWLRAGTTTLAMTAVVTPLIYVLNAALLGLPGRLDRWWELAFQVFAVGFLLVALRGLLWRRVVETRTIIAPPLPEAERAFRMRLSAKRRAASLIAIEAEDHYIRVHTDAGSELVLMRFSQAMAELAQAHGFRLHRSWWAAADAVERVRWKRGSGEAQLAGGLIAPVSRSQAATLKQAGWR